MRPLLTHERVAASADLFLDVLLGDEQRKTGWMRQASMTSRIMIAIDSEGSGMRNCNVSRLADFAPSDPHRKLVGSDPGK
jgi:hypothetical protein